MSSGELRQKFLDFFAARGHRKVSSSSLVPDDPSVLFTTAGMQQFKPYWTGELDPMTAVHGTLGRPLGAKNAVSAQKCFRTSDIDEVGDERHLTFFEMLGNFSFGGYFKKEAIKLAYEFLTEELKLHIEYVSVFAGDEKTPADEESYAIWQELAPRLRIEKFGREDNFWGPTGKEGPCGPTTEIYVKNTAGQDIEVWNLVFNEYYAEATGELVPIEKKGGVKGVDTGMGLERLAMVAQGAATVFETDLFAPLMVMLPTAMSERTKRIFADHVRAVAFLVSDGLRPSNKEAGYVLRRLIRRVIVQEHLSHTGSFAGTDIVSLDIVSLLRKAVALHKTAYEDLGEDIIVAVFSEENEKFQKTLRNGLHELSKLDALDVKKAFYLYETYGLPYEVIKDPEISGEKATELTREAFNGEFKKHQEISRAGHEKKFGGHGLLLDTGELKAATQEEVEKATRLHTATHMLQAALRAVLGSEVHQSGSDITAERLRFDFTFPRKMTAEELQKVEALVNQKVSEDLPVSMRVVPLEQAKKEGALTVAKAKYPAEVKVYTIGRDPSTGPGSAFSREVCGGPHVARTGIVGKFRITKEEACSAGVRRIRAVVE